jgi:hypothetical protein
MVRTCENIILILAVLGIVAATSLSGWMNKKAEAAPAPQIKGPSINVTPAPPIIIYPRPDRPMDAPRGALWKI